MTSQDQFITERAVSERSGTRDGEWHELSTGLTTRSPFECWCQRQCASSPPNKACTRRPEHVYLYFLNVFDQEQL